MKFGFCGGFEIVPDIFANLCSSKKSAIFTTLYNANVDQNLQISPSFAKNTKSLKEIFDNFIAKNLRIDGLNFKKASTFCAASNVLINAYLNNKFISQSILEPKMKVAKVIKFISKKHGFGISFDMKSAFKNFVFDKISATNKKCCVFFSDDMIVIQRQGCPNLGVLPCFREVSHFCSEHFDVEIVDALKSKRQNSLDKIYIVYPRNEHFRRHIEVKSSEFDENFTLKLVPYSINNKIFQRN